MSFPDEEDIYEMIEELFGRVFPLGDIELPKPFPRLTYAEAMARYGSDRPRPSLRPGDRGPLDAARRKRLPRLQGDGGRRRSGALLRGAGSRRGQPQGKWMPGPRSPAARARPAC